MESTSARSDSDVPQTGRLGLFVIAAVAAAVSLTILGFQFGVHNNAYHVPYVLRWAELPQFADDAFYQSLTYFTSAVWLLLRTVTTEHNVLAVFLVAHVLTHVATFYAFALLLRQIGLADRLPLALALCLMAVTAWLQQTSVVADHGLLLSDFSHTEVAWPFALFSLYGAQRSKWRLAAVHAALAFVCNAFVGAWLALILIALVARAWRTVSFGQLVAAAALYVVIAAPVLLWVRAAIGSEGALVDFSFRDYLLIFYPRHFLLDASSISRVGLLLAIAAAGWSGTYLVRRGGSFWRAVLLVSVAIFVAGALGAGFIDQRLFFNLHLLRVDGFIQLFSVLLVIGGALRVVFDGSSLAWQRGAMTIVLALLCVPWRFGMPAITVLCVLVAVARTTGYAAGGGWLPRARAWFGPAGERGTDRPLAAVMAAAAPLMAVNYVVLPTPASIIGIAAGIAGMALLWWQRRWLRKAPRASLSAVALMTVALVGASSLVKANEPFLRGFKAPKNPVDEAAWLALAGWVRQHPLDGPVLVPVEDNLNPDYTLDHNFQLLARTSVWVDWKQGAAVMWYPQFFHRWAPRYQAARQLRTPDEFRDFARAQGIPYFVPRAHDAPACPEGATTMHASGRFKLCSLKPPG